MTTQTEVRYAVDMTYTLPQLQDMGWLTAAACRILQSLSVSYVQVGTEDGGRRFFRLWYQNSDGSLRIGGKATSPAGTSNKEVIRGS